MPRRGAVRIRRRRQYRRNHQGGNKGHEEIRQVPRVGQGRRLRQKRGPIQPTVKQPEKKMKKGCLK